MRRRIATLLVIALAAMGVACRTAVTPPAQMLPPVALPDLAALAPSVQQQVRASHGDLTRAIEANKAPADLAAAYGALGRVLMAARFSDESILCYQHAAALAGTDPRWSYYLGHAYLRKGDRAAAARAFERAVALAPADINALVWLGETYFDDSRLDDAQSAFARALAVRPQSAAALFGAGRVALARRSYPEAVDDLERALAADSHATAVHYPLAMAYRALGQQDKAAAHLRQRGSTFPEMDDALLQDNDVLDSAIAYEDRGMQALKSGDFPAAADSFRKGLALDPDAASLRYWLGAALYAGGDAAGAEREFSAVAKRSPEFAKAHFSLGAIYDASGRRREAIDEYRAAVEADPGLPEARLRLADDLRTARQLEASVAQYEAAVRLDPRIAEAWIGGAQALIDLGRRDQAAEWLSRARRIHPGRPELAQLQARLQR